MVDWPKERRTPCRARSNCNNPVLIGGQPRPVRNLTRTGGPTARLGRSEPPERRYVPVIAHLLLSPVVRPEFLVTVRDRSVSELGLRDVGPVAVKPRVVLQLLPRDRVGVRADAEEAPEAHHRVDHAPADLLDDQMPDHADVLTFRVVDPSALDPVALDEGVGRRRFICCW